MTNPRLASPEHDVAVAADVRRRGGEALLARYEAELSRSVAFLYWEGRFVRHCRRWAL